MHNPHHDARNSTHRPSYPPVPTNAPPAPAGATYRAVGEEVVAEVLRARETLGFGPMHSAHEGLAVILEELDELKAHVWTNQRRRDLPAMRKEAIQLAAMALAFAAEVCDETRGRV